MIRGVLFDMDGVLVDSEEFICRAAVEMFLELGVSVKPEDFQPFVGMGENRYIGGVAEKYNVKSDIASLKARTYSIYGEITRGRLKPLPGALEFVRFCRDKGLKLALATSADKVKMEINLSGIGLSNADFEVTVNGLEVERKKPYPDIYLAAAEKLGLNPAECLVVEDAVSGVQAGKSAGCMVLAVTTSFSADKLHEADYICESLENARESVLIW